jgi:hypothetical protein
LLGIYISGTWFVEKLYIVNGEHKTAAKICLGALIHAHLFAVFFRSHNNTNIFKLYPYRFLLVPVLLWLFIYSSVWISVTASVVAAFWDVWHSGAQTFGFARIYERNVGVSEASRRLDYWLNQILYAGPIVAGATLIDHLEIFEGYASVEAVFFTQIPARVEGYQSWLTWMVLLGGGAFLLYYLFFQWQCIQRGEPVSWLKVFLLISTGACSIYSWGFNTWGEAFFMMNFFHAVQYLALVWAMEKKNIASRLRLSSGKLSLILAGCFFLMLVLIYGYFAEIVTLETKALWSVTMVVSLMHFWYDGFIWSVSKRQV